MLVEKKSEWQDPREGRRRWFYDDYFHLVVWYGPPEDQITGVELSYGRGDREQAILWHAGYAVSHYRVDNGERPGRPRMSPVLVAGDKLNVEELTRRFRIASRGLDPAVRSTVLAKLQECGGQRGSAGTGP